VACQETPPHPIKEDILAGAPLPTDPRRPGRHRPRRRP
jgi:hypothetical protein